MHYLVCKIIDSYKRSFQNHLNHKLITLSPPVQSSNPQEGVGGAC